MQENPNNPPELKIFDPILRKYREKIVKLRDDEIYKLYEST